MCRWLGVQRRRGRVARDLSSWISQSPRDHEGYKVADYPTANSPMALSGRPPLNALGSSSSVKKVNGSLGNKALPPPSRKVSTLACKSAARVGSLVSR
jgi:hypothetical protein